MFGLFFSFLSGGSSIFAQTMSVSFSLNGGTSGTLPASRYVTRGSSYGTADEFWEIPSREGYMFVGWNDEADGTGFFYAPISTCHRTTDHTLYAIWRERLFVPDVTACYGQTAKLSTTDDYTDYKWSPAAGLNDSTLQNPTVSATQGSTSYVCSGSWSNIFNADFTQGNEGFYSDYLYKVPSGFNTVYQEKTYTVTDNAQAVHDHFRADLSPVFGTHFLVCNGGSTSGDIVWEQTAVVTPGVDYIVSLAVADASDGAKPILALYVNGVQVGNTITTLGLDSGWVNVSMNWSSGSAYYAVIQLKDLQTAASGNDFLVDRVLMRAVSPSTISDTMQFTRLAQFNAGTIASVGEDICIGQAASTISNVTAASGGDNHITYQWYEGTTLLSGSNSETYTPADNLSVGTHVFTRWAKDGTCAAYTSAADSYTVTVHALPATTISGAALICKGSATILTAAPAGMAAYDWSPATGLSATNVSAVTASPAATTTYSVTATDAFGCANTAAFTLTVTDMNLHAEAVYAFVDQGNSNTLSAHPEAGVGPYSYLWNTGETSQTLTTSTALAAGAYTYKVTATDANGCTAEDSVKFTVNPIFDIRDFSLAICSGSSFSITPANGTDGLVPAGTVYSWSAPVSAGITGLSSGILVASVSDTLTNTTTDSRSVVYSVTPSLGTAVGLPFTVTVTVHAPLVAGSVKADVAKCTLTDSVKIINNEVLGSGGDFKNYSWEWSIDNGATWNLLSDNNASNLTPDYASFVGKAIFRRVYNTYSCLSATSNEITVKNHGNVDPGLITSLAANPSYYCLGSNVSVLMKANPYIQSGSTAYTVQWQSSADGVNFTNISGATDTTYTYTQNPLSVPISFRYMFTLTGCDPQPSDNIFRIYGA